MKKMNILFIHGNYPAQFGKLSGALAVRRENKVVFLTEAKINKKHLPNEIRVENYEVDREGSKNIHHYLQTTEECVLRGQAVIRGINKLCNENFRPHIVIFHGGMGLGLFLRDMLPNTILIGYFEWWFGRTTTAYLVEDYSFDSQLSAGIRNITTLREIEQCTIGVVPTEWQKKQFPDIAKPKLRVIFDGVDTNFFKREERSAKKDYEIQNRETNELFSIMKDDIIISYATRGMEPLRGFPEFMRGLPDILKKHKRAKVYIAGADRCAYSYKAPNKSGSWKEYMLEEVGKQINTDRINFTGLLNYNDYRRLLWRSDLHCYFTKPYVTSWSLFEATCCESKILTSKGEATSNIVKKGSYRTVDISCQKEVNKEMLRGIEDSIAGKYPRSKPEENFGYQGSLEKWRQLIQETLE